MVVDGIICGCPLGTLVVRVREKTALVDICVAKYDISMRYRNRGFYPPFNPRLWTPMTGRQYPPLWTPNWGNY